MLETVLVMEILDCSEIYKMGLAIRYQFGSSTDTMLIVSTPFSKRCPHKIQYNEKEQTKRALGVANCCFVA
jgi:hypothetical protein